MALSFADWLLQQQLPSSQPGDAQQAPAAPVQTSPAADLFQTLGQNFQHLGPAPSSQNDYAASLQPAAQTSVSGDLLQALGQFGRGIGHLGSDTSAYGLVPAPQQTSSPSAADSVFHAISSFGDQVRPGPDAIAAQEARASALRAFTDRQIAEISRMQRQPDTSAADEMFAGGQLSYGDYMKRRFGGG